jgi:uncharacterized protein YpmB
VNCINDPHDDIISLVNNSSNPNSSAQAASQQVVRVDNLKKKNVNVSCYEEVPSFEVARLGDKQEYYMIYLIRMFEAANHR